MPLEYEQNFGATALDQQTHLDREQGYAVIPASGHVLASGGDCEVTTNTGTLGTGNNALSVASGSVLFGGTATSVSAQSVDIATGNANPRKDVVYIDSNGSAQVREGSPAAVPSEAPGDRFQTWKPAPYDMHDIDGVVLATVWVADGASAVGSADLRDRRLSADRVVDELDSSAVTTGELKTTDASDITVNVPTDYDTVQGAVDDLSKRSLPVQTRVTVNIESGHLFKGLLMQNGYYGQFYVTSDDAVVDCDASFINNNRAGVVWNVQRGFGAVMGTKFDALNTVNNRGFDITEGSFSPRQDVGSGIINMDGIGLRMGSSSVASCRGMDFSGASSHGLATTASFVYAKGTDFSGAGKDGIVAQRGSLIVAEEADVSGAVGSGISCRQGALIDATKITATGCSQSGIKNLGGRVYAENGDVSDATSEAILAKRGGTISFVNGTATGCDTHTIRADRGSQVVTTGSTLAPNDTTAPTIRIGRGSIVQAHNATTENGSPDVRDTNQSSLNSITTDGIIFA